MILYSSFTLFWTRLINFTISSPVALSVLIIKLACFSDISAPPILVPFKPKSSISLPANNPSGFLNTEPADGQSKGWLAILLSNLSLTKARDSLVLPLFSFKVAFKMIKSLFCKLDDRYSKKISFFFNILIWLFSKTSISSM